MNSIIEDKLHVLTNTPHTDNLVFVEYKAIGNKSKISDVNLRGVRGSVRLSSLDILLPRDTESEKKEVLKYTFK